MNWRNPITDEVQNQIWFSYKAMDEFGSTSLYNPAIASIKDPIGEMYLRTVFMVTNMKQEWTTMPKWFYPLCYEMLCKLSFEIFIRSIRPADKLTITEAYDMLDDIVSQWSPSADLVTSCLPRVVEWPKGMNPKKWLLLFQNAAKDQLFNVTKETIEIGDRITHLSYMSAIWVMRHPDLYDKELVEDSLKQMNGMEMFKWVIISSEEFGS